MTDHERGTFADAFNVMGSAWNLLLGGVFAFLGLAALYQALTGGSWIALILAGVFALIAKWLVADSLQAFKRTRSEGSADTGNSELGSSGTDGS